jgi:hypothetical protein
MTLEQVLPIWWSLVWRCVVFSMVVGAVLGFCGGFILGMNGHPELAAPVGALLGWLGSIPVSIWSLKAALEKHGLVKA